MAAAASIPPRGSSPKAKLKLSSAKAGRAPNIKPTKFLRAGAICTVMLVSGCGGSANSPSPAAAPKNEGVDLAALSSQVQDLTAQVQTLRQQLAGVKSSVTDLILASFMQPQEKAFFDPQEQAGYSTLRAPAGPVLAVLERVEPYLDGYIVYIRLGNPTSAQYAGLKGKIWWGRKIDSTKGDDYNQLREADFDLNDQLAPSSWTVVKLNVAPAHADEVRRIVFAPTFNQLRLRAPFTGTP